MFLRKVETMFKFIQLFFGKEDSSSNFQKVQDQANDWIMKNCGNMKTYTVDTKFAGTGAGGGSNGSVHGKHGVVIQILYEANEPIKER